MRNREERTMATSKSSNHLIKFVLLFSVFAVTGVLSVNLEDEPARTTKSLTGEPDNSVLLKATSKLFKKNTDSERLPNSRGGAEITTPTKVSVKDKVDVASMKTPSSTSLSQTETHRSTDEKLLSRHASSGLGKNRSAGLIRIGDLGFSPETMTSIGDIDENGFEDFVVSFPYARNSSGAISIYLMGSEDTIVSSRHLVPGKWGFNGVVPKPGEQFGSFVTVLPDLNGDGIKDLAVTSRGEKYTTGNAASLYVLLLHSDGSVLDAVKISQTAFESKSPKTGVVDIFGNNLRMVTSLDKRGRSLARMKTADGSQVSFLIDNKKQFSVDVTRPGDLMYDASLDQTKPSLTSHETRRRAFAIHENSQKVSVRPIAGCIFNETACACSQMPATLQSYQCLDYVGLSGNREECVRRDCKDSYKCNCNGTELCRRYESSVMSYVADETIADTRVYCHRESFRRGVVELMPGASVSVPVKERFRKKTCKCSPKTSSSQQEDPCIVFHHAAPGEALICEETECIIKPDEMVCDPSGASVCELFYETKPKYVHDGQTDLPKQVYCFLEDRSTTQINCIENCPI